MSANVNEVQMKTISDCYYSASVNLSQDPSLTVEQDMPHTHLAHNIIPQA